MSTTYDNGHETTLERVRYFPRQLISADDLTQEQRYHRQKLREHNRFLHGWGIVCGCDVQPAPSAGSWYVRICPGYLLAPQGDSVYIRSEVLFDLAKCSVQSEDPCAVAQPCPPVTRRALVDDTVYLAVRTIDCDTRPVRVAAVGCSCDEADCEYSRVRDGFEFCCLTTLPDTHAPATVDCAELYERDDVVACPDCPENPWVVLATIKLPSTTATPVTEIDPFAHRRVLYSTAHLQELAFCVGQGVIAPWHEVRSDVYHNNTKCAAGSDIELREYRRGTGNRPLCGECASLAKEEAR